MDYLDTFEQHITRVADKYRYKKDPGAKYGPIEIHCLTALRAIEVWRADLAKIKHETIRDDVIADAVSLMILDLEIGEMAGREQRRISHPRPARDARRAIPVNDLIKQLRDDLWSCNGNFRGNSKGTAAAIFQGLNAKLGEHQYPRWHALNLKNATSKNKRVRTELEKAKDLRIDAIRKRLDRM